MIRVQSLRELFDAASTLRTIGSEIPDYIVKNLNPNFILREYQKEALLRFEYYLNNYPNRTRPAWLLFQMATGSGKTLVMAAQILHLYAQGYRNFIFFVNSTNIIEKTRQNFLNPFSAKYLFAERIAFGDREVKINEVFDFESSNSDDINILFTTIQGLHTTLNLPRENSVTFEDFKDKKIALISDEAHHINTLTKGKLTEEDKENKSSWENTVTKITKANEANILLEFTATIDMENPEIRSKYHDKLIYEYSLRQFRQDGYSKEVNVLESDIPALERALQAIVLSQYRRKIAEKNKIFLKPVVLMKSKTITESKSFEEQFHRMMKELKKEDLQKVKNRAQTVIMKKAFQYFEKEGISLDNLAKELREDFEPEKCLPINSEEDSEEKQLTVNSLEDRTNQIRAIFAVNMLNEGWDVLNLFDIVRLYETRDAKAGKPGKTTIAEAQLIGRGARYFPFTLNEAQDKYRRKFDQDTDSELKILEDFYYHSRTDSRYIQELRQALVSTGILPKETKEIQVNVKDSIKKTDFWKNGKVFLNQKVMNDRKHIRCLSDLKVSLRQKYTLYTGQSQESEIFESANTQSPTKVSRVVRFSDMNPGIVRKAMAKLDFYAFSNISQFFPNISSSREFMTADGYIRDMEIEVTANRTQIDSLSPDDYLHIAVVALDRLSKEIQRVTTDYVGTKEFNAARIKECVRDKSLNVAIDENTGQERGRSMKESANTDLRIDLSNKDWYIYDDNYGTSEEKYLIKFIDDVMDKLRGKFAEVYLLRNEKLFQIYRFSDGSAIEPDFVLFLKESNGSKKVCYQLFVESKGDWLIEHDRWKEDFLRQIQSEHRIVTLFENERFKLVGMPFFNESLRKGFVDKLQEVTGLQL